MKRHAFTLVELLVVISIIGLLSTVAVVSLNSSRSKARDTKRIADVKQLMTAMYLYYDANGRYPDTAALGCPGLASGGYCLGSGNAGTCWGGTHAGCTALDTALSPYIAKIPDDPSVVGPLGDAYFYYSVGTASGGGVTANAPLIHWGMEQVTTPSVCLGGPSGTWGACGAQNCNWCFVGLPL